MKELLPLGSIVILKEGEKKLMIYGRGQYAADNMEEEFDYVACLWPEGNLNEEFIYLFNHLDVASVFHYGYSDDEDTVFLDALGWF